jgi:hypothetical protein
MPRLPIPVRARASMVREDTHEAKGSGSGIWRQGRIRERGQHAQYVATTTILSSLEVEADLDFLQHNAPRKAAMATVRTSSNCRFEVQTSR